jgi:hypothetical protein
MSEATVAVIFEPTGEVDFYPRSCWELLLLRRSLAAPERERMDKLTRLLLAKAWPYSPAEVEAMDRASVLAAIDALPEPLESDSLSPQEVQGAR